MNIWVEEVFVEYWGFSRGNLETSDMGTAGTVY